MPPASPWGKKPQTSSLFSGLPETSVKTKGEPPLKTQYEEIQEDELIALASIYGEDFCSVEKRQTAWQVSDQDLLPVS